MIIKRQCGKYATYSYVQSLNLNIHWGPLLGSRHVYRTARVALVALGTEELPPGRRELTPKAGGGFAALCMAVQVEQ